MTPIEQHLRRLGKDYLTLADTFAAIQPGISKQGYYLDVSKLPEGERPEDHGAFRAGGTITFCLDAGVEWALRYAAYRQKRIDDGVNGTYRSRA